MKNLYELAEAIYVQEAAHGQRAPDAARCIELAGAFIRAVAKHEADQEKTEAQLAAEAAGGGETPLRRRAAR
jgi:hypothetical protein